MADDAEGMADYREAIESLLLDGEELEAMLPAGESVAPDSDDPKAVGVTSHRLIVCYRRLRAGTSDRWRLRTIPYASIDEIGFGREEQLRREPIETSASVLLTLRRAGDVHATRLEFQYRALAVARELHDRIAGHLLASHRSMD